MVASPLLTLDETAELTKTSRETLRYWRKRGEGPPSFRVGRRVMYREEAVLAWLTEQEAVEAKPSA